MEPSLKWIIFSYRIPSDTSTLRVRAWRILRRIGAVNIQQSVCVVPNTELVSRKLRQLQALIEEVGGHTHWLDIEKFSEETSNQLVPLFNQNRAQEYTEFIEACDALTTSLSVAQCETERKRLQKWFRKLQERDYFHCQTTQVASKRLMEMEEQLVRWMGEVSST